MVCITMPTQHRDSEQDELDERDRGELGKPVGGLAHGQGVVDAVEVVVAFAPDELRGVQGGDDVEEERRAAFHRLEHEVGDGPDVDAADSSGELAVVDGEDDQQADDGPERNLAGDGADSQAREREVLREGSARAEHLPDARKAGGDQRPDGPHFFGFLQARLGGALPLRTGGESFHRHGEERHRPPRESRPTAVQSRRL